MESSQSVEEAEQLLNRCRQLSQRVGVYSKKLVGEADALAVEVKSLLATSTSLLKGVRASPDEAANQRVTSLVSEAQGIIQGLGPGGDLRRFLHPHPPLLLRLLLGDKVSVVTIRKDQAVAIREEYHAFRGRAVWVMFVVPLALYLGMKRADSVVQDSSRHHSKYTLTPPLLTGLQCYLGWLTYFYVAMALRECVLLLNGSHIRSWWISHHYYSALVSLLLLALPVSSPTVYRFAESFMLWSAFQAVVMLVQNLYQRRRMYTRIALGKNNAMDVVSGESSGSQGQLFVLYPMLFILQGWQLFIGAHVAWETWPAMMNKEGWLDEEPSRSDLRGMRGTFIGGCIFSFMAVMNFINTIATITEKHKYKHKQRDSSGSSNGATRSSPSKAPAKKA